MKKGIKWFLIFTLLYMDVATIIMFNKYDTQNKLVSIFVWCITAFFIFKLGQSKLGLTKKQRLQQAEEKEAIQQLRNGVIPTLYHCSIILKENERAVFECPAYMSIVKNKLVGSTGSGGGISVRVARGVYMRSGNSGSRKIYKDVKETYSGTFVVTNQRMVFVNIQKGFEIPFSALTSVCSTGSYLNIQSKTKGYKIFMTSSSVVEEMIKVLAR